MSECEDSGEPSFAVDAFGCGVKEVMVTVPDMSTLLEGRRADGSGGDGSDNNGGRFVEGSGEVVVPTLRRAGKCRAGSADTPPANVLVAVVDVAIM